MSIESARAFCMRMMSDDEFRDSLGKAESAETIRDIIKKDQYDFNKHDLLKIVSELTGKKLEAEQLEDMVCGIYNRYTYSMRKRSRETAKRNPLKRSAPGSEVFDYEESSENRLSGRSCAGGQIRRLRLPQRFRQLAGKR